MIQKCEQFLHQASKWEESQDFLFPVNKQQNPTYYEVIQKPMDLQTVRKNLKALKYKKQEEFFQDIIQIVDNCKLYNCPDSEIYRRAEIFLDRSDKYIYQLFKIRIKKLINNNITSSSSHIIIQNPSQIQTSFYQQNSSSQNQSSQKQLKRQYIRKTISAAQTKQNQIQQEQAKQQQQISGQSSSKKQKTKEREKQIELEREKEDVAENFHPVSKKLKGEKNTFVNLPIYEFEKPVVHQNLDNEQFKQIHEYLIKANQPQFLQIVQLIQTEQPYLIKKNLITKKRKNQFLQLNNDQPPQMQDYYIHIQEINTQTAQNIIEIIKKSSINKNTIDQKEISNFNLNLHNPNNILNTIQQSQALNNTNQTLNTVTNQANPINLNQQNLVTNTKEQEISQNNLNQQNNQNQQNQKNSNKQNQQPKQKNNSQNSNKQQFNNNYNLNLNELAHNANLSNLVNLTNLSANIISPQLLQTLQQMVTNLSQASQQQNVQPNQEKQSRQNNNQNIKQQINNQKNQINLNSISGSQVQQTNQNQSNQIFQNNRQIDSINIIERISEKKNIFELFPQTFQNQNSKNQNKQITTTIPSPRENLQKDILHNLHNTNSNSHSYQQNQPREQLTTVHSTFPDQNQIEQYLKQTGFNYEQLKEGKNNEQLLQALNLKNFENPIIFQSFNNGNKQ